MVPILLSASLAYCNLPCPIRIQGVLERLAELIDYFFDVILAGTLIDTHDEICQAGHPVLLTVDSASAS